MKVTCRSNGTVQLFLEPETAIESAYIEAIVERAEKGSQLKIAAVPSGQRPGMSVTMEA